MSMQTNSPKYAASICIPRGYHKLTWSDVKSTFETAFGSPGCVQKVDLILREDDKGRSFKRIFVHFKTWPTADTAVFAMENMKSNDGKGTFQLVYDDPWYWKCSLSRVPPPTYNQNKSAYRNNTFKSSPYISFENTSSVSTAVSTAVHNDGCDSDDGEIDDGEFIETNGLSVEDSIREISNM